MRLGQVLCIIYRIVNSQYEFLLLKRIPEKGGFWQPPSGGVESEDKSKLEAAYREVHEEVLLNEKDVLSCIENVHSYTMSTHYLTGEPTRVITENVFAFQVKSSWNPRIDKNIYPEHTEFKWVSYDEALKMLKWQNNKDAFVKLNQLFPK